MKNRIIVIFSILVFLFPGLIPVEANNLPDHGMLPDSPFYFLKNWSENIGTFFTFGNEAKAERLLGLSEKRLAEAEALIERGNSDTAQRIIERYQKQLNNSLSRTEKAKERGRNVDAILTRISEATLRHQEVLINIHEKVPEEAKSAIEKAIEKGMRGHKRALKAISNEKRQEIIKEIENKRQKLDNLRKEGIPIPDIPNMEEIEGMIPDLPER